MAGIFAAWTWIPCATLAAILLFGCGRQGEQPAAVGPKVEGESVVFPQGSEMLAKLGSIPLAQAPTPMYRLNGRLTWNEDKTVRIYTPFAGRVTRILVQNAHPVEYGEPLLIIE